MELDLTPTERAELFGDFDPSEHEQEASQRWGDTYRKSARRASTYTKEDWTKILSEAADISTLFGAAMVSGELATSEVAMGLAEEHRAHISRWFYECSLEIHRGLGEMYVSDPRFTANYEAVAPGLAVYIRDAITANASH